MESFEIVDGKVKILISAPHVFPHRRPDSEVLKKSEEYTDYIARNICSEANCLGIVDNGLQKEDPNYYLEIRNDFKSKIRQIVKQEKIKYVLDIHGLKDNRPYDFAIYCKKSYKKSKELAYLVADALNNGVLKECLFQIKYFNDDNQETISEFCADKLKVPAVQIKIARYVREDEKLRRTVIENLGKWIVDLRS